MTVARSDGSVPIFLKLEISDRRLPRATGQHAIVPDGQVRNTQRGGDHEIGLGAAGEDLHQPLASRSTAIAEFVPEPIVGGEAHAG
jgi:hypothetical protein